MEDKIYRVFGARLRDVREDKRVTQEELARRVELSRTSITNIEQGRQRVLLHQVLDLAKALETDVNALLPSAASVPDPSLQREDVVRVVESLKRESNPESGGAV